MRTLIVLLLVALSLSPAPALAQSDCTPGVVVGIDGQVDLSGTGKQNTRPFDLAGGAYTLRWSASGNRGGNVIMHLKRTDGTGISQLLVNTIMPTNGAELGGETQVYAVKSGTYYLDLTAPGPWSVQVYPQQ
jgi:hypothetical protein